MIDLLGHVSRGDMVTLVPTGAMLTTQQGRHPERVAPGYLSKLLKEGEIPFIPVGSHRRVMHEADLMAYKERRDAARTAALDELARLGQDFRRLLRYVADRFVVVLDANVLFPFRKRDVLLRFSHAGLFRARWSGEILASGRATFWP